MTAPPAPRPRHDFSPAEIDGLEDRLYAYNRAATGRDDGRGLGFEVVGEGGVLMGAIAGYSWAGIAEARQVWVADAQRRNGLGRSLMQAFMAEAARRGCARMFLLTYDFQAPGFYEKLGFRRVATLEDFPEGHAQFVYRKDL